MTSLAGGGEEMVVVPDMMDCKNRSGAVTHTSIPTADQHPGTGTGEPSDIRQLSFSNNGHFTGLFAAWPQQVTAPHIGEGSEGVSTQDPVETYIHFYPSNCGQCYLN